MKRIIKYLILGILIVFFLYSASAMVIGFYSGHLFAKSAAERQEDWQERTAPLDEETIVDLCDKFGLLSTNPLCVPDAVVFGPDFFQIIKDSLTPEDGEGATYDEVESYLAEYRYFCEEPVITGDGDEYFSCEYDLVGDRVYPIIIFYNKDNSIRRIIADVYE